MAKVNRSHIIVMRDSVSKEYIVQVRWPQFSAHGQPVNILITTCVTEGSLCLIIRALFLTTAPGSSNPELVD